MPDGHCPRLCIISSPAVDPSDRNHGDLCKRKKRHVCTYCVIYVVPLNALTHLQKHERGFQYSALALLCVCVCVCVWTLKRFYYYNIRDDDDSNNNNNSNYNDRNAERHVARVTVTPTLNSHNIIYTIMWVCTRLLHIYIYTQYISCVCVCVGSGGAIISCPSAHIIVPSAVTPPPINFSFILALRALSFHRLTPFQPYTTTTTITHIRSVKRRPRREF